MTRLRGAIAAFAVFTSLFATSASFAGTQPSLGGTPDLDAIVRQLAAAQKDKDATESCDSSSVQAETPMLQQVVSGGGGGFALSGAPTLWVSCALPYTNGKPGGDCTGKHILRYNVTGATANAKVTAELMALDTNGTLLKSFLVKNGDNAQLASRLSPSDWKFVGAAGKNKEYTVFAPLPLFRVTVEDQGQKAVAYCSDVPWVDVVEPSGGVVTETNEGDSETKIVAAVPLTNPSSLQVLVDGDNLLADLATNGQSIATCTVASPCDGVADINGEPVQYTGLIIDIATGITAFSSNTVSLALNNLSCGTHNVQVTTSKLPGTLKNPTTEQCHIDNLTDLGTSSVFAIKITDPTPQKVTSIIPTPVAGLVCGGTEITDLNINGKVLPVAGQVESNTPGGPLFELEIDTLLDETDLKRDLLDGDHTNRLGTFDIGTNRLVAAAKEIGGKRAFKRVIFATGNVAPIGTSTSTVFQESALKQAINQTIKAKVDAGVQQALSGTTTSIENAFVVGLSAEGTQTLFTKLCTTAEVVDGKTAGQLFKENVTNAINAIDDGGLFYSVPVPCTEDPNVELTIAEVSVGETLTCTSTFEEGQFKVRMDLPNIYVKVNAYGEGGGWGADVCGAGVRIQGYAEGEIKEINLQFTVTEDNLLNDTFSAANFDGGLKTENYAHIDVDFCGFSVLCEVVLEIFTLGQIDLDNLDFSFVNNVDFSDALRTNQPDPVKLKGLKVDETRVANFDQQLEGILSSVEITSEGISAGLRGEFATLVVDGDVETTPGITLTPVQNVPKFGELRNQGALDALIGLSDDSINMMFASLTAAGNLKIGDEQGCVDTGVKVGSILPSDCDDLLIGGDNIATAEARGYCEAIKGGPASCNSLHYITSGATEDLFLTSVEQGACHGASGSICTDVFGGDLVKLGSCSITPNFNLKADQGLLLCAKGAVPPRMVFPNPGSNQVDTSIPTALRINDFSVSLVIDRTGLGVDAPLATLPGCFGGNLASDCNVFSACLDINMNFGMNNLVCPDGKPGFKAIFDNIQIITQDIGVVCSGATSPTTDDQVLNTSSDDTITIPLGQNAGTVSPDICGAGLSLGNIVSCASPQIVSLEADGLTNFRDYLGITCTIQ